MEKTLKTLEHEVSVGACAGSCYTELYSVWAHHQEKAEVVNVRRYQLDVIMCYCINQGKWYDPNLSYPSFVSFRFNLRNQVLTGCATRYRKFLSLVMLYHNVFFNKRKEGLFKVCQTRCDTFLINEMAFFLFYKLAKV